MTPEKKTPKLDYKKLSAPSSIIPKKTGIIYFKDTQMAYFDFNLFYSCETLFSLFLNVRETENKTNFITKEYSFSLYNQQFSNL